MNKGGRGVEFIMSLRAKVVFGLVLVALYGVMVVFVALSLPASDKDVRLDQGQLWVDINEKASIVVRSFLVAGELVPADAYLAIEEPDVLPDYKALSGLFDAQDRLTTALANNELSIVLADGTESLILLRSRSMLDLPPLFWLQIFCGLAGVTVCLLVWLPSQRGIAINSFAITGVGYVVFSSAAAIYSTRDLFISGHLFQWLSGFNHFGALLFSGSLAAFLWNFPRKAPSAWLSVVFYGAVLVSVVLEQGRMVDTPVEGFHLWVMGIFLVGLLGAGWQWYKTRGHATDRAAARWVAISIVAGTAFFAGGMILPAILQVAHPPSQGLLFTTFLFMYAGMALGVARYRLFNLERWWFSIWVWLFGGFAVLITDMLLAMVLTLSGQTTMALSLALVGWCYFPFRQYFWGRLLAPPTKGLDAWLSQALPVMLRAQRDRAGDLGVEEAVRAVFNPLSLSVEIGEQERSAVAVLDNGETLCVPDPHKRIVYFLRHAQQGTRLFSRQDASSAELILALNALIEQALSARAEGASEERNRIRQDIHDDLGAKLLQLLHTTSEDARPLVREAIQDLRNLLRNMEGHPILAEAAASQWHEEVAQRCRDHGVALKWQANAPLIMLDAGQYSALTRVLREAVSNALRHASPSCLRIALSVDDGTLCIEVSNDGIVDCADAQHGRGLPIMNARMEALGGECGYHSQDGRWTVRVSVPMGEW